MMLMLATPIARPGLRFGSKRAPSVLSLSCQTSLDTFRLYSSSSSCSSALSRQRQLCKGATAMPTWCSPWSRLQKLREQASRIVGTPRGLSSLSFSSQATTTDDDHQEEKTTTATFRRKHVRNCAIIAHVDHGKTTLVDELLKATERSRRSRDNDTATTTTDLNRLMDSGELEKERGITITSKVTRMEYKSSQDDIDYILNIVDTPGHADFCGEVDRVLSMVDGVCLVVDAAEGPMTQTKYVLSRAIAMGLQPVVVLNKCDRADALQRLDSGETEEALAGLFDSLGASDAAKNHVTMYASARKGWIVEEDPFQAMELSNDEQEQHDASEFGMETLLNVLIREIPEPTVQSYLPLADNGEVTDGSSLEGEYFAKDKFSLAATTVGFDKYLGRTCTGRIVSGSIQAGDTVQVLPRHYATGSDATAPGEKTTVSGVFVYAGIERKPYEARAFAGDCVTLTGVPDSIAVGDTVTSATDPVPKPVETPPLAPPTLSMDFGANNGPLAGKEGNLIASSKIRERLLAETDNNVTLKVEKSASDGEKTVVFARGELQLGILVEQMRREGFEIVISPPRILTYVDEATGKLMEPFEEVVVDVDAEYAGLIVSALTGDRKGILMEMNETSADGKTRLVLEVPSRGLLGFASEVATATRGSAVINHFFKEDREHVGSLSNSLYKSKLVSNSAGKTTAHALSSLAARGTLFIEPGTEVYPGMVIGENSKGGHDLEVNPVRTKELTNMRSQAKDEKVQLAPPKRMSFEELVGYMAEDEMIEVTPKSIRLRKALLDNSAREQAAKKKAKSLKAAKA